jgi:hypothetical protein
MISPFIFAYILYVTTKNKSETYKQNIGIILSAIAVLLLLLRNIEIFVLRDFTFDAELVPLQICHFANFVLLFAFIKNNKNLFGLAFLFNLPLAYLSLVFADGLENYSTIINFRGQAYIWGHMLIVIITLYAYLSGFIKVDLKRYLSVAKLVTFLYILSAFVNNIFRIFLDAPSNYFYTEHPEKGTPLEFFYSLGNVSNIGGFEINIAYMISLLLFGYFVVFVFYLLCFEIPKYIKEKQLKLVSKTT